jgi:ferric-dicitrate binding protein FerR (iron transport regulator)
VSCNETWGELISALEDGELRPEEAQRVREHLRGCAECTEYRAALVRDRSQYRETLLRAADAVRGTAPAPAGTDEQPRSQWGWRQSLYVFAAVTAGLAVGILITSMLTDGRVIEVGQITAAMGHVEVRNSGQHYLDVEEGVRVQVRVPDEDAQGASLSTGRTGAAVVGLDGAGDLEVGPESEVVVLSEDEVRLDRGWVTARLHPRPPGDEFSISTARGDYVAVGTRYTVQIEDDRDWLLVDQGVVEARPPEGEARRVEGAADPTGSDPQAVSMDGAGPAPEEDASAMPARISILQTHGIDPVAPLAAKGLGDEP